MQTPSSNALYTDGGLIRANPSAIGGTWAWIRTEGGEEVARRSGLLLPRDLSLPTVSNNNTELLALIEGIAELPDGWHGTVYSDSGVASGQVFHSFRLSLVPVYLRDMLATTLKDAANRGVVMESVLLAGHPSKKDLEAGYRVSKAPHLPVSPFNVACDAACTRRAEQYLRVLAHREVAQYA